MEADKHSYTTFVELGGRKVDLDEVRAHLRRLELDMVLGILAHISAHRMRAANEFFNPSSQGRYLAYAIADDFPAPLPGAATMYIPNRIPITGGRHNFIHEHGLAALAQLAILNCRNDGVSEKLAFTDFGRICRLLLILNDHLGRSEEMSRSPTLTERRRFAINALYAFQFNHMSSDMSAQVALARLHQLLIVHLPGHLPHAAQLFEVQTGISLSNYLLVAGLMLAHMQEMAPSINQTQSPWTNIDTLAAVPHHADEVKLVLELFRQSPADLRRATEVTADEVFDFAALQRRSLIEVRPDHMIWPVFSLFVRQLLSYPLQVLAKIDGGLRAVGHAYQDYAQTLVERMARGDVRGPWMRASSVPIKMKSGRSIIRSAEIDDALWRDGIAVVFEHKAGNLVLTLGDRDALRNAMGPTDRELATLPDLPTRDTSALTHGMWQLARISADAAGPLKARFGDDPKRVFPIITTLESFEVDDWIRGIYLDPLLAEAGITLPAAWSNMQWITVVGLEALAQLADDGRLDLVELLEGKAPSPGRFVAYLAERFHGVPPDRGLAPVVTRLMNGALTRYFGASLQ